MLSRKKETRRTGYEKLGRKDVIRFGATCVNEQSANECSTIVILGLEPEKLDRHHIGFSGFQNRVVATNRPLVCKVNSQGSTVKMWILCC